jgi:coenzyme F420 hydrogenase subunit beta
MKAEVRHEGGRPEEGCRTLFETVVEGGYCIGCGMCAALGTGIEMQFDQFGQWKAEQSQKTVGAMPVQSVCPFADGNPNEDELSRDLFPDAGRTHPAVGRYLANFAGHGLQGDYRARGSSGGLLTWMVCQLLEEGHVDAVIHVGESDEEADPVQNLFGFRISTSAEEARMRAKSRYYPVEMSRVVKHMIEVPGRYAVVGLPCFIKALRLACRQSAVLNSRVSHTIGLVCGHLKSRGFAEMIGWQLGVPPEGLRSIDFRVKRQHAPANDYAVAVSGIGASGPVEAVAPTASLFGTNWGHGFFKYKACDYCDDVLAETADVAVGDAWLPEYVKDSGGTSVLVVRTEFFRDLLQRGFSSGQIHLENLSADEIADSQDAGLRHRRQGLAYRLFKARSAGEWMPTKRVEAGFSHLSAKQRQIFDLRTRAAELSHTAMLAAKQTNDFGVFVRQMQPIIATFEKLYTPSLPRRFALKCQTALRKLNAFFRERAA